MDEEKLEEFVADEEPFRDETIKKEPTKEGKLKKRIWLAVFVVINAVVIFFTARAEFTREAPKAPREQMGFRALLFLLGGLLCLAVVLAAETAKYMLMMKHLGEKVSFSVAFKTAALGRYYDCVTPSGAGGQPFQIWYLHSNGYSDGAAAAMPLSAFFTMQFGFVTLCLVIFPFFSRATDTTGLKIAAYIGAVAYTVVPVMILISAVKPVLAEKIVGFFIRVGAKLRLIKDKEATEQHAREAIRSFAVNLKKITKNRKLFIELMALSIVYQLAMMCMPYFAVRTFGGELEFFRSIAVSVFVYASVTIVPTPGNSGAAEGSFYILFSRLDTAGVFWAMLLWRVLCYYSFIVIGVAIYLTNAAEKLITKRKKHANEA